MKDASVYDNTYCDFFVEHLKLQHDTPLMPSKHYHDFYEIYYYLGNKMNYFVGDQNYSLEGDNIVLIDKYIFHRTTYNFNNKNERILIEFNEDVFNIITDKNISNRIKHLFNNFTKIDFCDDSQKTVIRSIIFNLVSNYRSKSQYGLALSKLNLIELCLQLVEFTDKQDVPDNNTVPAKKSESGVVDIIKYINENYSSKITLDTLTEIFFVNKYYLCHVFKNETGLSIIDFVNSKRLAEAEKLLRYSDGSITDICFKVGFSSINYFLKLFKSAYKVTPKKFRYDIRKQKTVKI